MTGDLSCVFRVHMVADKSRKGAVIQEMACLSATGPRKTSGHRIRSSCPRLLFSLILKRHGQPASVPWATRDEQRVSAYHEVHARHPESALRPRRARQRERQLREIHRGRESHTGPQGRREAPRATQTPGREQTAPGSQRARARPHAQRQHGLRGSAHPHPHGAGGKEVVENRDPAIGVQLHFAPGQRAAARGRLQGRTAVCEVSQHLTKQQQPQKSSRATHLHFLPWQPKEDVERRGQAHDCVTALAL